MITPEHGAPASQGANEPDLRGDWLFTEQDSWTNRAELSASYHGKRERFFGIVERVFQAIAALTATAAFADIAGKGEKAQWFALVAAVSSIMPLVFGFAENARKHGQLKAGFKNLLASTYELGAELTEGQVSALKSRIAELEAGEPAPLAALTIQCQNEIALREKKTIYPLRWWELFGCQLFSFNAVNIINRSKRRVQDENPK